MEITRKSIHQFAAQLKAAGPTPGTIGKYLRDDRAFAVWLDGIKWS